MTLPADRTAIWVDFAEHFLDTETRHLIPASAGLCVSSGVSIDEGCDIWRFEVTPAVSPNLWSVAGEWSGWDREWLCARIAERRRRLPIRVPFVANLRYRLIVHFNHEVWPAIAACMAALERAPEARRQELVKDLTWLARHYFDLRPGAAACADRATLSALYQGTFLPIFERMVHRDGITGESRSACHARVEGALASL